MQHYSSFLTYTLYMCNFIEDWRSKIFKYLFRRWAMLKFSFKLKQCCHNNMKFYSLQISVPSSPFWINECQWMCEDEYIQKFISSFLIYQNFHRSKVSKMLSKNIFQQNNDIWMNTISMWVSSNKIRWRKRTKRRLFWFRHWKIWKRAIGI